MNNQIEDKIRNQLKIETGNITAASITTMVKIILNLYDDYLKEYTDLRLCYKYHNK